MRVQPARTASPRFDFATVFGDGNPMAKGTTRGGPGTFLNVTSIGEARVSNGSARAAAQCQFEPLNFARVQTTRATTHKMSMSVRPNPKKSQVSRTSIDMITKITATDGFSCCARGYGESTLQYKLNFAKVDSL